MATLLLPAGNVVLAEMYGQNPVEVYDQDMPSQYSYSKDWAVVSAPPPPGPYQTINVDPRVPGQDSMPPFTAPQDRPMPSAHEAPGEFYPGAPPAAGMHDQPMAPGMPAQQPSYGYRQPPGRYPPHTGGEMPGDFMQAPPGAGMPAQQSPYGYSQPPGRYLPRQRGGMAGDYRTTPGGGQPESRPMTPGMPSPAESYGYPEPPGYYMPRGQARGEPLPGEGYSRSGRYPRSGYPGAGYESAPYIEEEVPPPPVYDRMTAQPPIR